MILFTSITSDAGNLSIKLPVHSKAFASFSTKIRRAFWAMCRIRPIGTLAVNSICPMSKGFPQQVFLMRFSISPIGYALQAGSGSPMNVSRVQASPQVTASPTPKAGRQCAFGRAGEDPCYGRGQVPRTLKGILGSDIPGSSRSQYAFPRTPVHEEFLQTLCQASGFTGNSSDSSDEPLLRTRSLLVHRPNLGADPGRP